MNLDYFYESLITTCMLLTLTHIYETWNMNTFTRFPFKPIFSLLLRSFQNNLCFGNVFELLLAFLSSGCSENPIIANGIDMHVVASRWVKMRLMSISFIENHVFQKKKKFYYFSPYFVETYILIGFTHIYKKIWILIFVPDISSA